MAIQNYLTVISSRISQVKKVVAICSEKLSKCPEGDLVVHSMGGKTRYILLKREKQIYLGHDKTEQIKAFEEKNYYKKLKQTAEREIKSLEKVIKTIGKTDDVNEVFFKIPEAKRNLIKPFALQTIDNNLGNFCQMNDIAKQKNNKKLKESSFMTSDGVKVRSKSELIIAERFIANKIPYYYEPDIYFESILKAMKPDFQVYNKRTGEVFYWEHFGMMDNPDYLKEFQFKMNIYADGGIFPGKQLIMTTESSGCSLSTQYVDLMIKEYLL